MAYIVSTYLNGIKVDSQSVAKSSELKDNPYVEFNKKIRLTETAGDVFTGGENGETTGQGHQEARDAFESYAFNILNVPLTDKDELKAYYNYTKRQREEYGVKFQMVCPYVEDTNFNYEGVIQYGNTVKDSGVDPVTSLSYWIAGAEAGCQIQNSVMGEAYTGRYNVDAKVTRARQIEAINKGILLFHNVGNVPVVLKDINSLTTITSDDSDKKSEDFKNNQTIRVVDGRATQISQIFNNRYLAKMANTDVNRAMLKTEVINTALELANIQAIEPYDESLTSFEMGNTIRDVIGYEAIQPTNAMEKLFMTISVI